MTKRHVTIVNSKSFGKFTNVIQELEKTCHVSRIDVPKDIDGAKLAEKLRGSEFVIATSHPQYTEELFRRNEDIVAILIHGIGIDNVDLNAATKHGVVVTRVPGIVERESVAELAITMMLNALRHVVQAANKVREGKWMERAKYVGSELAGKTVGIIGMGNIGSRVAEILLKGFNAKVLAYDPYVPAERVKETGAEPVDFDSLLSKSDIITLHCLLTKETYHILNEDAFKKVKKGVILVNTARGALIDTDALVKALEEKVVGAVAFDVVENEPIDESHPLLRYENVIITPHIGAYTLEALRGMDRSILNAINSLLREEVPEGIVNKDVFQNENLRVKKLYG